MFWATFSSLRVILKTLLWEVGRLGVGGQDDGECCVEDPYEACEDKCALPSLTPHSGWEVSEPFLLGQGWVREGALGSPLVGWLDGYQAFDASSGQLDGGKEERQVIQEREDQGKRAARGLLEFSSTAGCHDLTYPGGPSC